MISLLSDSFSTMRAFSKHLFAVVLVLLFLFAAAFSVLAFPSGVINNGGYNGSSMQEVALGRVYTLSATHRKLLFQSLAMKEPNRIPGDQCSKADIVVNQGPTGPLPNGIPTYTVEINNVCATGCNISDIHVSCGWFSSARLVNPKIFRRIRYNNCLVNDGKPLDNGGTLSFEYANTFPYPLSVSSVHC